MINKSTSFLIALFLLILITFDAFQQKFYIDTFSLGTDPVSLKELLQSQAIRWFVWLMFSIPFALITWKQIRSKAFWSLKGKLTTLTSILTAILLSILCIGYISIVTSGLDREINLMIEFFTFFAFQKGLTFFMAYSSVILLLISYSKTVRVEHQSAEITSLKRASEELNKTLQLRDAEEEKRLTIKTGNKVDSIPLDKIIWIQADDYCVKIHTESRSYSLRKSLKLLEAQLKPFRFIRIHRGALLNLQYVDQINYETSTIRLQNESELPLSQSGIKTLKRRIKETTH